jgi:hypothetical protein
MSVGEEKTKVSKSKKLDYEKLFNEIFGTNIKWSKLSIEELTQLATVIANPEPLIRRLGGVPAAEVGQATLVEIAKRLVSNYEGPIIKLLKKYLSKEGGQGA